MFDGIAMECVVEDMIGAGSLATSFFFRDIDDER
jgi:hypothetical protein